MDKLTLKDKQEIRDIGIRAADNGGAVLSYTIYTPAPKNSENGWDNKTEVFTNKKALMDRVGELYELQMSGIEFSETE